LFKNSPTFGMHPMVTKVVLGTY